MFLLVLTLFDTDRGNTSNSDVVEYQHSHTALSLNTFAKKYILEGRLQFVNKMLHRCSVVNIATDINKEQNSKSVHEHLNPNAQKCETCKNPSIGRGKQQYVI